MQKILVIEDEKDVRNTIVELLNNAGYSVFEAEDGQEGIDFLKDQIPDLVISDIMMPKVDGYKVLEYFQILPATMTIPFIFLTAKADPSDVRKGMNTGADDYLTKPFRAKELLEAVKNKLEKKNKIDKKFDEIYLDIAAYIPHELRTPLIPILGFTELLSDGLSEFSHDESVDMLEKISASGHRLHRTIEKFIRYTEIKLRIGSNGKLRSADLENVMFAGANIELTCNNIVAEQCYRNRKEDINITTENVSLKVSCYDFNFIIHELMENALKFSKPGSEICLKGFVEGNKYVVEVVDNGMGMTKEQLLEIRPFKQHERKKYEQSGNGLGLVTVKGLVEYYKGGFDIVSVKNKQTKCIISLPISQAK